MASRDLSGGGAETAPVVLDAAGNVVRGARPGFEGATQPVAPGIVPNQPGAAPTTGDITRGDLPPLPAPTSEMGMIIQMMIDQGRMQRATPESLARGIGLAPRTPGVPATATQPGATPLGVPPLQHTNAPPPGTPPEGWVQTPEGRWIDPGVAAPVMPDAEFQAIMQEVMRNGYTIPADSPLYARRNEILREVRRRDPNARFQNTTVGGGGEGGGQGTAALSLQFDPRTMGNAPVDALPTPALRALIASGLYGPGGGGELSPEVFDAYGGEEILRQLQAYDPNARWDDLYGNGTSSGGEGGLSQPGRRLVYDRSKLPISEAEKHGWQIAPVYDDTRMVNPEMTYYDPIYGRVTDVRNLKQDPAKWWEVAAPIAISLIAPYAAPALFGALGAPAMAAGFTSAVTAGAAGLPAASVPGSFAAGYGPVAANAGPKPTTVTGGVRTAGQTADQLTQQPYRPTAPDMTRPSVLPQRPAGSTAPPGSAVRPGTETAVTTGGGPTQGGGGGRTPLGQEAGYNPANYAKSAVAPVAKNGMLNDPYAQQGVTTPKVTQFGDPFGFDPTAFNAGGSAAKPNNNSKLVATQFADDPYRFS